MTKKKKGVVTETPEVITGFETPANYADLSDAEKDKLADNVYRAGQVAFQNSQGANDYGFTPYEETRGNGFLGEFVDSAQAGALNMLGGALGYADQKLDEAGIGTKGGILSEAANYMNAWALHNSSPQEELTGARWWGNAMGNALGSSLPTMLIWAALGHVGAPAALAGAVSGAGKASQVAKCISAIWRSPFGKFALADQLGNIPEAASEAGNVVMELRNLGFSDDVIAEAASKSFWGNVAELGASDLAESAIIGGVLGKFGSKMVERTAAEAAMRANAAQGAKSTLGTIARNLGAYGSNLMTKEGALKNLGGLAANALNEGQQEYVQSYIEDTAKGDQFDKAKAWEAAKMGAAGGLFLGGAGTVANAAVNGSVYTFKTKDAQGNDIECAVSAPDGYGRRSYAIDGKSTSRANFAAALGLSPEEMNNALGAVDPNSPIDVRYAQTDEGAQQIIEEMIEYPDSRDYKSKNAETGFVDSDFIERASNARTGTPQERMALAKEYIEKHNARLKADEEAGVKAQEEADKKVAEEQAKADEETKNAEAQHQQPPADEQPTPEAQPEKKPTNTFVPFEKRQKPEEMSDEDLKEEIAAFKEEEGQSNGLTDAAKARYAALTKENTTREVTKVQRENGELYSDDFVTAKKEKDFIDEWNNKYVNGNAFSEKDLVYTPTEDETADDIAIREQIKQNSGEQLRDSRIAAIHNVLSAMNTAFSGRMVDGIKEQMLQKVVNALETISNDEALTTSTKTSHKELLGSIKRELDNRKKDLQLKKQQVDKQVTNRNIVDEANKRLDELSIKVAQLEKEANETGITKVDSKAKKKTKQGGEKNVNKDKNAKSEQIEVEVPKDDNSNIEVEKGKDQQVTLFTNDTFKEALKGSDNNIRLAVSAGNTILEKNPRLTEAQRQSVANAIVASIKDRKIPNNNAAICDAVVDSLDDINLKQEQTDATEGKIDNVVDFVNQKLNDFYSHYGAFNPTWMKPSIAKEIAQRNGISEKEARKLVDPAYTTFQKKNKITEDNSLSKDDTTTVEYKMPEYQEEPAVASTTEEKAVKSALKGTFGGLKALRKRKEAAKKTDADITDKEINAVLSQGFRTADRIIKQEVTDPKAVESVRVDVFQQIAQQNLGIYSRLKASKVLALEQQKYERAKAAGNTTMSFRRWLTQQFLSNDALGTLPETIKGTEALVEQLIQRVGKSKIKEIGNFEKLTYEDKVNYIKALSEVLHGKKMAKEYKNLIFVYDAVSFNEAKNEIYRRLNVDENGIPHNQKHIVDIRFDETSGANTFKVYGTQLGVDKKGHPTRRRVDLLDNAAGAYMSGLGLIFINPNVMDASTPIHEVTHAFVEIFRAKNPDLWKNGKALLKDNPLFNDIANWTIAKKKQRGESPDTLTDHDYDVILEEVFAYAAGYRGADLLEKLAKTTKDPHSINVEKGKALVDWVNEAWMRIRNVFAPSSEAKNYVGDERNAVIDAFLSMPFASLQDNIKNNNFMFNQSTLEAEISRLAFGAANGAIDKSEALRMFNRLIEEAKTYGKDSDLFQKKEIDKLIPLWKVWFANTINEDKVLSSNVIAGFRMAQTVWDKVMKATNTNRYKLDNTSKTSEDNLAVVSNREENDYVSISTAIHMLFLDGTVTEPRELLSKQNIEHFGQQYGVTDTVSFDEVALIRAEAALQGIRVMKQLYEAGDTYGVYYRSNMLALSYVYANAMSKLGYEFNDPLCQADMLLNDDTLRKELQKGRMYALSSEDSEVAKKVYAAFKDVPSVKGEQTLDLTSFLEKNNINLDYKAMKKLEKELGVTRVKGYLSDVSSAVYADKLRGAMENPEHLEKLIARNFNDMSLERGVPTIGFTDINMRMEDPASAVQNALLEYAVALDALNRTDNELTGKERSLDFDYFLGSRSDVTADEQKAHGLMVLQGKSGTNEILNWEIPRDRLTQELVGREGYRLKRTYDDDGNQTSTEWVEKKGWKPQKGEDARKKGDFVYSGLGLTEDELNFYETNIAPLSLQKAYLAAWDKAKEEHDKVKKVKFGKEHDEQVATAIRWDEVADEIRAIYTKRLGVDNISFTATSRQLADEYANVIQEMRAIYSEKQIASSFNEREAVFEGENGFVLPTPIATNEQFEKHLSNPEARKKSIQKQLADLREQRKTIVQQVNEARKLGDLSENAEYQFSKEKLVETDKKIRQLETNLRGLNIKPPVLDPRRIPIDRVTVGTNVVLKDESTGKERTVQIVAGRFPGFEDDDDVVGVVSDMGHALIGGKVGQQIIRYDNDSLSVWEKLDSTREYPQKGKRILTVTEISVPEYSGGENTRFSNDEKYYDVDFWKKYSGDNLSIRRLTESGRSASLQHQHGFDIDKEKPTYRDNYYETLSENDRKEDLVRRAFWGYRDLPYAYSPFIDAGYGDVVFSTAKNTNHLTQNIAVAVNVLIAASVTEDVSLRKNPEDSPVMKLQASTPEAIQNYFTKFCSYKAEETGETYTPEISRNMLNICSAVMTSLNNVSSGPLKTFIEAAKNKETANVYRPQLAWLIANKAARVLFTAEGLAFQDEMDMDNFLAGFLHKYDNAQFNISAKDETVFEDARDKNGKIIENVPPVPTTKRIVKVTRKGASFNDLINDAFERTEFKPPVESKNPVDEFNIGLNDVVGDIFKANLIYQLDGHLSGLPNTYFDSFGHVKEALDQFDRFASSADYHSSQMTSKKNEIKRLQKELEKHKTNKEKAAVIQAKIDTLRDEIPQEHKARIKSLAAMVRNGLVPTAEEQEDLEYGSSAAVLDAFHEATAIANDEVQKRWRKLTDTTMPLDYLTNPDYGVHSIAEFVDSRTKEDEDTMDAVSQAGYSLSDENSYEKRRARVETYRKMHAAIEDRLLQKVKSGLFDNIEDTDELVRAYHAVVVAEKIRAAQKIWRGRTLFDAIQDELNEDEWGELLRSEVVTSDNSPFKDALVFDKARWYQVDEKGKLKYGGHNAGFQKVGSNYSNRSAHELGHALDAVQEEEERMIAEQLAKHKDSAQLVFNNLKMSQVDANLRDAVQKQKWAEWINTQYLSGSKNVTGDIEYLKSVLKREAALADLSKDEEHWLKESAILGDWMKEGKRNDKNFPYTPKFFGFLKAMDVDPNFTVRYSVATTSKSSAIIITVADKNNRHLVQPPIFINLGEKDGKMTLRMLKHIGLVESEKPMFSKQQKSLRAQLLEFTEKSTEKPVNVIARELEALVATDYTAALGWYKLINSSMIATPEDIQAFKNDNGAFVDIGKIRYRPRSEAELNYVLKLANVKFAKSDETIRVVNMDPELTRKTIANRIKRRFHTGTATAYLIYDMIDHNTNKLNRLSNIPVGAVMVNLYNMVRKELKIKDAKPLEYFKCGKKLFILNPNQKEWTMYWRAWEAYRKSLVMMNTSVRDMSSEYLKKGGRKAEFEQAESSIEQFFNHFKDPNKEAYFEEINRDTRGDIIVAMLTHEKCTVDKNCEETARFARLVVGSFYNDLRKFNEQLEKTKTFSFNKAPLAYCLLVDPKLRADSAEKLKNKLEAALKTAEGDANELLVELIRERFGFDLQEGFKYELGLAADRTAFREKNNASGNLQQTHLSYAIQELMQRKLQRAYGSLFENSPSIWGKESSYKSANGKQILGDSDYSNSQRGYQTGHSFTFDYDKEGNIIVEDYADNGGRNVPVESRLWSPNISGWKRDDAGKLKPVYGQQTLKRQPIVTGKFEPAFEAYTSKGVTASVQVGSQYTNPETSYMTVDEKALYKGMSPQEQKEFRKMKFQELLNIRTTMSGRLDETSSVDELREQANTRQRITQDFLVNNISPEERERFIRDNIDAVAFFDEIYKGAFTEGYNDDVVMQQSLSESFDTLTESLVGGLGKIRHLVDKATNRLTDGVNIDISGDKAFEEDGKFLGPIDKYMTSPSKLARKFSKDAVFKTLKEVSDALKEGYNRVERERDESEAEWIDVCNLLEGSVKDQRDFNNVLVMLDDRADDFPVVNEEVLSKLVDENGNPMHLSKNCIAAILKMRRLLKALYKKLVRAHRRVTEVKNMRYSAKDLVRHVLNNPFVENVRFQLVKSAKFYNLANYDDGKHHGYSVLDKDTYRLYYFENNEKKQIDVDADDMITVSYDAPNVFKTSRDDLTEDAYKAIVRSPYTRVLSESMVEKPVWDEQGNVKTEKRHLVFYEYVIPPDDFGRPNYIPHYFGSFTIVRRHRNPQGHMNTVQTPLEMARGMRNFEYANVIYKNKLVDYISIKGNDSIIYFKDKTKTKVDTSEWINFEWDQFSNGLDSEEIIDSAENMGDAAKLSDKHKAALEEEMKKNPDLKNDIIIVRGKSFADSDIFVDEFNGLEFHRGFSMNLMKVREEVEQTYFQMSAADTQALTYLTTGGERHKLRNFAHLRQRKGKDGWIRDVYKVIPLYITQATRFIGMSDAKWNAVEAYERQYGEGSFLLDVDEGRNDVQYYIKEMINIANGGQSNLERKMNHFLHNVAWFNAMTQKYFNRDGGNRIPLLVANTINGLLAPALLGCFNLSAGLVNLTQIKNVVTKVGFSDTAKGFEGAKYLWEHRNDKVKTARYLELERVIKESGVFQRAGISDVRHQGKTRHIFDAPVGFGEDTIWAKTKRLLSHLNKWGMWSFETSEKICRVVAAIGAYEHFKSMSIADKEAALRRENINYMGKGINLGTKSGALRAAYLYSDAVDTFANYDYGVYDAPGLFRKLSGTGIGELMLLFQKYGFKEFEIVRALFRSEANGGMSPEDKRRYLMTYIMVTGFFGFPFADLLDAFGQDFFDVNPTSEIKHAMFEEFGDNMITRTLAYGAAGAAGIDIGHRTSLAGLAPSHDHLVGYMTGVFGAQVSQFTEAMWKGNPMGAITGLSPSIKNLRNFFTGEKYSVNGYPSYQYDAYERVLRLVGLRSTGESQAREEAISNRMEYKRTTEEKKDVKREMAQKDHLTFEDFQAMKKAGVTIEQVNQEKLRMLYKKMHG